MKALFEVLIRLKADLTVLRLEWALIGGLAVSVRAEPRTTRDVDIALSVGDDPGAEEVTRRLVARGYRIDKQMENRTAGRLATVRLLVPGQRPGGVVIDVMFASSGIEPELVAAAEPIEIVPGLTIPVARTADLIALKVLAGRQQDVTDLETLLSKATSSDVETARERLELISRRPGYDRDKDLLAELTRLGG